MKIQFLADADLHPAIGQGLVRRKPAISWLPAQGVIADGTPDSRVLRLAARLDRVLVTGDVSTMLLQFAPLSMERYSPGLILVPPGLTIGDTIERPVILWASWTAEDIRNQAWWL